MWAQLGLTGLSALSGLLGGRPRTTTQESNASSSGVQDQSGFSRRYLTPEQQFAQALLAQFSANKLDNPLAGLDGVLQVQRNKVNNAFTGGAQRVANATLAHGGSSSGKFNRGVRQMEMARAGALTDVNAQLPSLALSQQAQASQLLMQLLGMSMGEDTQAKNTFSQESNSFQKSTGPNTQFADAFGSAAGTGAFLYGMGKKK